MQAIAFPSETICGRCALRLRHMNRRRTHATNTASRFKDSLKPAQGTTLRSFSSTPSRPSHIGSAPVSIPPGVELEHLPPKFPKEGKYVFGRQTPQPALLIKGPKGSLKLTTPAFLKINHDQEARRANVSVEDRKDKYQRSNWGTYRSYISNMVIGVSEGHSALLRMVGVGYRASIEAKSQSTKPAYDGQPFVCLRLGLANPVELGVPVGIKATVPQPTRILLEGIDKHKVKQFAAEIRAWRKPEPYKGKGIFVDNETIQLKAKKIK